MEEGPLPAYRLLGLFAKLHKGMVEHPDDMEALGHYNIARKRDGPENKSAGLFRICRMRWNMKEDSNAVPGFLREAPSLVE